VSECNEANRLIAVIFSSLQSGRDKERSDEELPIPNSYRNIFILPILNNHHKMGKQICPKCGSNNVRIAETTSMLTQSMVGWECLDCGYIGKDFFVKSKKQ